MSAPTRDEVQMMMLRVADPAYFEALKRGETGAEALKCAVQAVMEEERGGCADALPIERVAPGVTLWGR